MSAKLKFRAQPRIPGVRRKPRHTSLIPFINQGLEAIARHEGKYFSFVAASFICDLVGYDAATGEKLTRKEHARRLREARRLFHPRKKATK